MTDDPELTEQDRLVAVLVELEQRLPGGYQVALDLRLAKSIEAVDRFFTERGLPMREQLIAELTLWHCHAADGLRLMERSYRLLQHVIHAAGDTPRGRGWWISVG